jgi:ornithine carbamoyltransferase
VLETITHSHHSHLLKNVSLMVLTKRDFLDLADFTGPELRSMLELAKAIKGRRRTMDEPRDRSLAGRKIAMVFELPSLRTRLSFDVGVRELGGEPLFITKQEIDMGERESVGDTAAVISRMIDGVMIRMLDHGKLKEFAAASRVPVINGLSRHSHPCQVMADILTFEEHRGAITGKTMAWIGDANNVFRSFVEAGARLGFDVAIAHPPGFGPKPDILAFAGANGKVLTIAATPQEAVTGAALIVTDGWASMGDTDGDARKAIFQPYQVNAALMAFAPEEAVFMHCLPAKRGQEVTDEVMDGPQSLVFDEAENRLHAQKAIMATIFGGL